MRIGIGEKKLHPLQWHNILYRSSLHCRCRSRVLVALGIRPPIESAFLTDATNKGDNWTWYLVETAGTLLLVRYFEYDYHPCFDKIKGFQVLRVDNLNKELRLTTMGSLDELMLFFDANYTM